MVEMRFSFFSPSIFSFGKAMTHGICCFCQHMILFSNFGKENYSSFHGLKRVGAVMFFLSRFFDGLLLLPPVLLPDLNMVLWHFLHIGFEKMKLTLAVLSELIRYKVSFIVCHPLLLAGGCADTIALLFSLLAFHFFVSQTSLMTPA